MTRKSLGHLNCGWAQAAEAIGDKWSILIVRDAFFGVRTFSAFETSLGISKNILTQRLEHLVKHEILKKQLIGLGSTRFEYRLTEKGDALLPVIIALAQWSDERVFGEGKEPYKVMDRASNKPIKRMAIQNEDGEEMEFADLMLTAGPGANENNKRLVELMAEQSSTD